MALKMDIDNPLKRSSSAPMINDLNSSLSNQPSVVQPREPVKMLGTVSAVVKPRRFSTSCTPMSPLSGPSSPKMTHRVNQLKREESVDVLGREAAHERELNSAMVMSQSWEDLTLVTEPERKDEGKGIKIDPLQIPLNSGTPPLCSTPSPTRTTPLRHCLTTFKTSLTPSPTRKFTRRSQSPIGLRPSSLGNSVKRKFEIEENEPPAKKFSSLIIQQSRFEPLFVPNKAESFDKRTPQQETVCTAQSGTTD